MSQHGEQRIRELYEAALTRPPGQRASYVARVAGPDTELRERVQALLSGQADTVLPGYEPGSDDTEQLLTTGTQIGSYRIEGPLGAGGMGVVYFATDTKLNRPAAIKVLPENLADTEARRRFQREAQLVSSLNHPHIVTVYDAGEYEGRQYLITEYVDGGTLRQWARRPRGWQAIVELLIGVADGIAVAHEAGILHRDIKPENVLLAKNGYAKLADFGIAKLLETDPLADDPYAVLSSDQHSTRVGTAAYMSPQQLQGQPLDARSDVYSFGLTLYELLAGRRAFADATDPSAPRTLAPLPAELPVELRTVIGKALEPAPENRYQTMRDLVVDLRRLVRRSEVDNGAIRPWWWRSLGYAAALAGALAVGLLARDYVRDTSDATLIPPPNAIAVLPFTSEAGRPEDAQLTEDLGDGVRDRLMALPGLSVLARPSSAGFAGPDDDVRKLASSLGVRNLVRGSLTRRGELLDVRVEILDDKGFAVQPPLPFTRPETQLLALEQEIARRVGAYFVPESRGVAAASDPTAQREQANKLILFGIRRERAVKEEPVVDKDKMRDAIAYYRRAMEADPMSLSAHSHLAAALLYLSDDAAPGAVEAMVALLEAKNSLATPADLSDAYYTFALYLLRYGKDGADKQYERAIQLNPSNADAHEAYAQWLEFHIRAPEGNEYIAKADDHFRAAIQLDPLTLYRYDGYAEYLGNFRENVAGVQALAQTIEQRFHERGDLTIAHAYELIGELDVGIAYGLKAYRFLREAGSSTAPQVLEDARAQIAELYAKVGERETARAFEPEPGIGQLFFEQEYDDLSDLAEESVLDNPNDSRAVGFLTTAYNVKGEFAASRVFLEHQGYPFPPFAGPINIEANASYMEALKALGANDDELVLLVEPYIEAFEQSRRNGQRSWALSAWLACAQAMLGRSDDALDSLDFVKNAKGLAWSPMIEDRFCFTPLQTEPRYKAVVEHLRERQRELRERLPATLKEYGVADVQP
jgi:serine/threonine protein kinase/tetratricopeptide (TPR) repeat protein